MPQSIRQRAAHAGDALLEWYRAARRELPWRGTRDPYRIWVSEIMLQQTRVETVVPYYERWLRRFPDLEALADAAEDDVLRQWEGLGYYRRARNLHRGARLVRERHAGRLPADLAALRDLPGIGEYTAGAIASIAFGARTPAIDGNARRVLCRVFDLERPTAARLREAAASWLPDRDTGDFNQAVMELGARVCTPASPRCDECPVATSCLARVRDTRHLRPGRSAARPMPERTIATAVLMDPDDCVLLVRRPDDGLLARLWELPGVATTIAGAPAAARRIATELLASALPRARRLDPIAHAFSHFRATYHPFLYRLPTRAPTTRNGAIWATTPERARLALPVAQRKILQAARPAR